MQKPNPLPISQAPPTPLSILRMVVPSWFIFAGLLSAMFLNLEGQAMNAAVIFGAFLTQATYFVFFEQTISPFFPESKAYMRNVFGIFAILLLAVSLVFMFS